MSSEIARSAVVLLFALLLFAQGWRAQGLRRRAFLLASAGSLLLALANFTVTFWLALVGLVLLALALVLLILSWRTGELQGQVERYRTEATTERERQRRKRS